MDDEVRHRVGAGEVSRGRQLRSADMRPHSAAMPGNTAIVTGGASGIGLGIAEALLDRGMNVVVADVRDDHLAHAQDHLRRHGSRLMPRRLDVTDRHAWLDAVEATGDRFGAVDVLCLNAGIGVLGTILRSRPADWEWLMGVNLEGVTHGLETVLPLMRARGAGGHVVATSSAGGLMVASDGGIYSTAKFGVIAVMDCLRTELSAEGIGVTTLCPAGVNTNIHDHETMRPAAYRDSGLRGDDIERAKAQQAAREMLSKGADPRDVGKRVLDAIDEDAPMVFTDGGIAPVVTMRRDALMRAARLTAPVRKTLRPGRIVLAEPVGETRAGRALTALGCQVDVLDMKAVDTVMEEPEQLGDPSDAAPLVLAIAPQSPGGSRSVDWTAQVHQVLRRCFTIIRGLVPGRIASSGGGGIAVVLPTTALFADSARCADSVLGRSLVGLIEGLRAELLARRSAVTLVLTHEGEEEAVLAKRIHDALRDGPLYALPSSATDERVASVFDPWLEALARTPSDVALPPLGPMGEVYRLEAEDMKAPDPS
ncbi:SDR family oxidoreductase [Streptomyces griseorubiginosus]|uniref:SDR family oxidoreductase n=1 Tax=Streptomyces griseorubiginosus TaxID=67304 RepID=UPI001B80BF42|nr:SDR family NAD(P)-dependent oxidoreductase [Streptomyces griseorubiginosus]